MAANKFATMLHRRTNRITLILIYAVLEWALILLLLLNSLFSFLILRFADYFGLPRPCPWCSRLDHIFDPRRHTPLRDLLCHRHASEVSRLSFCSTHRRLADFSRFCDDCSGGVSASCENGDTDSLPCSCCGSTVARKSPPCCHPLNDDDHRSRAPEEDGITDHRRSDAKAEDHCVDDRGNEEFGEFKVAVPSVVEEPVTGEKKEKEDYVFEFKRDSFSSSNHQIDLQEAESNGNDESLVDSTGCHLEFFIGGNERELIPVEWTDSPRHKSYPRLSPILEEEPSSFGGYEDVIMDFCPSSAREPDVSTEGSSNSGAKIDFLELNEILEYVPEEVPGSSAEGGPGHETDADIENKPSLGLKFEDSDAFEITEVIENASEAQDSSAAGVPGQELDMGIEKSSSLGSEFEDLDAFETTEIIVKGSEEERVILTEEGNVQFPGISEGTCYETEKTSLTEGVGIIDYRREEEECTLQQNDDINPEVARGMEIPDQECEGSLPTNAVAEEECVSQNDDIEPEVSIGTDIPEQEAIDADEIYDEETLPWDPCREGDADVAPSTSRDFQNTAHFNDHDPVDAQSDGKTLEFRSISVEMSSEDPNHQLEVELTNENDDENPDTPNSSDSLHQLHRRLLFLEKPDSGSTDESLDGRVMGDVEGDEGAITVDELKTALKAERKALRAIYTELEEERSASAEAASHTMAMINRLQEEKAAMQMEALQYQRMMEEQAEYDQEALQLLNDLMVKREKEKEELEMELEAYQKKVEQYEAKEMKKAMMVVPRDSKDSSDSCSNEEESDGSSIDLHEDAKGGEDAINGYGSTPGDAVWYLEESLADFEAEKASILKQLKSLEDKILYVNGEEEEGEWRCKENGNGHVETFELNGEVKGSEDGHCTMNGNGHYHRRLAGPKAKNLLPLFDAIGEETVEDWSQKTPANHFADEDKKIAVIEDEVDHIHERLQVLEADREFLKHCIGSLRKGDKGLELLSEILQHLRDLRCTELHGQNIIIGDGIVNY